MPTLIDSSQGYGYSETYAFVIDRSPEPLTMISADSRPFIASPSPGESAAVPPEPIDWVRVIGICGAAGFIIVCWLISTMLLLRLVYPR
jgi:hypothetical protein